jgi:hypothetical protein
MQDTPKATTRRTGSLRARDFACVPQAIPECRYPPSPCPIHFAFSAKWVGKQEGSVYQSWSRLRWVCIRSLCLAIAAATLNAQTPTAAPANTPDNAPAQTTPAAASPAAQENAPTFATPPVAIVPLDKSIPGAALDVAGSLQAWNGRAYLTGSGSISAGTSTAEVTLPYRGTMHVCASSTVKLAADSNAPAGEVPGLLIALDRGAVEMSFAASTAREKNADTLLTPYFRILIGGPNAADVKVRLGEHGDTCVDNVGANAPYVVVSSVFEGGLYRVQPGQRVMFEHGSLQSVVDQEKEPCGCPPPVKSESNEFPLAQSEGLAPPPSQTPVAAALPPPAASATTSLIYNATDHAAPTAGPATAAPPPASATPAPQAPAPQKKPGFFGKIGQFFKRIFGAE